ncbi:MAG: TolC family outer membrane protein [Pseudomonadota bacterium]
MIAQRHPRWTRHLLALAACLLAGGASAQVLRLGSLLELARANDAQYAAARAAFDAGREKLPQAIAANRPQINLSYSERQNRDGSTAYDGTKIYDAGGAALTVTQTLFRLANQAGTELAELQVQLAQQQLQAAEQDLLLRVARGYFDVLQAQDELAAATAQKEALTQQLNQARRGFELGMSPVTDFNEAQARHDLGVAQEIAARGELASRTRVLEKSIARPLGSLARLSDGASVTLIDAQTQDDLVAAAPRSGLQVLIGRTVAQIAQKEVERREAGHHPTLDLVATLRRDRNVNFGQFGGSNTRQFSVGVELALPLYQGGLVSSRVREALAESQRAQQELSNAERQARLDAQQAQLGVASGAALTRALVQALSSSETQLRSTQRGLQVGVRTRVDVLNAEQQLFVTRKDLAAARYRTVLAGLQLRAAAGALTEADLRMLDSLLAD